PGGQSSKFNVRPPINHQLSTHQQFTIHQPSIISLHPLLTATAVTTCHGRRHGSHFSKPHAHAACHAVTAVFPGAPYSPIAAKGRYVLTHTHPLTHLIFILGPPVAVFLRSHRCLRAAPSRLATSPR